MDNLDLQTILHAFEHYPASELELSCASFTIKIKRSSGGNLTHVQTTEITKAETVEHRKAQDTSIITSPIVGTFYLTPAPDAPPYVQVGDAVDSGSVICTIEAMKMMNQLEAEYPCEIVRVLAGQGSMVEFGQPLFEVKRR